eukprot:scaffold7576_cov417-Prasinococcus_capsulatus_cf.AAC.2
MRAQSRATFPWPKIATCFTLLRSSWRSLRSGWPLYHHTKSRALRMLRRSSSPATKPRQAQTSVSYGPAGRRLTTHLATRPDFCPLLYHRQE